ncbi:MAG: zinc-binding dehydrogenase, partial [Antricoccus sp.]
MSQSTSPAKLPSKGLQLRSLVTDQQTIELSLTEIELPEPQPNEVVVAIEATPLNPSDLGLLFAGADMSQATISGDEQRPVVTAALSAGAFRAATPRVGRSLPVGNEGAGRVVAAGSSAEAQALLGTMVALSGGAMYTQYRHIDAAACLPVPDGTSAKLAAASFVNPMTTLGMIYTMRAEGHTALVHTAAASNLGQMLVKLCLEEGIPLVNIVRSQAQCELLLGIGATHVLDSSTDTFTEDLIAALTETGATLAFDAIGGGKLASQILTCMESALSAGQQFSGYGSATHKQVYLYGGLDTGPTELRRAYGMAWGVGGWLLPPFLGTIDAQTYSELRQRVANGLTSTFASSYTDEVSLQDALKLEN